MIEKLEVDVEDITPEMAQKILDWIAMGEQIVEKDLRPFYLFRAGAWWSDRPWRKRP